MTISPSKLNALKVVLAVGFVLSLLWGISSVFSPQSIFDTVAPAGEPFTDAMKMQIMITGALALGLAAITGIVLRDPLRSPSLILALAFAAGLVGVVGIYGAVSVVEAVALTWVNNLLLLVLAIALLVLYPWGQRAT